jgi:hypothetical protein
MLLRDNAEIRRVGRGGLSLCVHPKKFAPVVALLSVGPVFESAASARADKNSIELDWKIEKRAQTVPNLCRHVHNVIAILFSRC